MLGKQWVIRYLRNRGGSAAEKSRDRQWKLWIPEVGILPHRREPSGDTSVRLAVARMSLVAVSVDDQPHRRRSHPRLRTFRGRFIHLPHSCNKLYHDRPYQTPLILVRTAIRYLKRSDAAVARSLRSFITSLPSIKDLRRITSLIRSGFHSVLDRFCRTPTFAEEKKHTPLAVIVGSPTRIFEDILLNWEVCKTDACCISWVLESTTDPNIIFFTLRFTAGA